MHAINPPATNSLSDAITRFMARGGTIKRHARPETISEETQRVLADHDAKIERIYDAV